MILKDARFITHLSKKDVGEDIHIVRELIKDENGELKDNVLVIKDFKRPFWVTKEIYRNHKDKKESEELKKVQMFKSTESDLAKNIAPRLGNRYIGVKDLRLLKKSPYLYGVDTDSRAYLKYMYKKKYNNFTTEYRVGTFDIEADPITNKITIVSLDTGKRLYTYILKEFVKNRVNVEQRILDSYEKYVPDTSSKYSRDKIEIKFFDNEVDLLKAIFKRANESDIDFLAVWNIAYDLKTIESRLKEYNVDIKDIIHYDGIPKKYSFYKFKEGNSTTARGAPIDIQARWHVITATSKFYFLDAMSVYYYVRANDKSVPGGYSLDNILEHNGIPGKLKFEDEKSKGLKNVEWHLYMIKNRPIEYIVYNMWDVGAMQELEKKNKDMKVKLPVLASISPFSIFNSNPKKLVNELNFYLLKKGRVLATKDPTEEEPENLGKDNWIVTLDLDKIVDNGMKAIEELDDLRTNIRLFVYDSDVVSSYPSVTMACNVSKDTTHRELLKIEGMDKESFKLNNINLMFGPTNAISYMTNMFNFPNQFELLKRVKNKINQQG